MEKNIFDYVHIFHLEEFINNNNVNDFELKTYEAGSFLLMTGEKKRKIYLFVEGVVKVTLFSKEGDEMLLELMKPFDILGDIEYVLGNENTHNVQVIEKCRCLEISEENIKKNPILYKLMAKTLAGKLLRSSMKISNSQLLTSKELVLNFITENKAYVTTSLKYHEMAKLVGISERQLRRIIRDLEREGLVKRLGKKLFLI